MFDFPSSGLTVGQVIAGPGGINYKWDGVKWTATPAVANGVTSFNTRVGAVVLTLADITGAGGAPLASPVFTGSPAAPTAVLSDVTTKLATTAFVRTGVSDGSSASVGLVGEYMSAVIASGSALALTTATARTIASLVLTAGDWDVAGELWFTPAATTTATALAAGIGTTANAVPAAPADNAARASVSATSASSMNNTGIANTVLACGPCRMSLAATTTVYIAALATFAVSTLSGYGRIRARRLR